MARVLTKILRPINHVPLASEVVYSMGDTFCIYFFLGTLSEILTLFETQGVFNTVFEHRTRFLTQRRVFLVIWFAILFPERLN